MGLFIRNQDSRTELQTKIAAELQEKLKHNSLMDSEKVEPAFTENQHHTRPAGIIVILLVLVAIAIITAAVSTQ